MLPTQIQSTATQQDDLFTQQIADKMTRWGLKLPALLILEAGSPLTFFIAQSLWVAAPTLSLFSRGQTVSKLAQTLEDRHQLQQLIDCLEQTS